MRLMASGAALPESQANIHCIELGKSGQTDGMGIVAIGAITHRTRMLNLGFLYLLGLVGVTGNATRLGIGLRQHNLAVLRRSMAGVTLSTGKRAWSRKFLSLSQHSRFVIGVIASRSAGCEH